jgi:hypothetical protein
VKLYVCWNTNPRFLAGKHPCGIAYHALRKAGHDPEVVKAKGWRILPDAIFNRTEGRREAKRLTGKSDVPVLVLDDGEAVAPARAIIDWAKANPAGTSEPASTG